MTEQRPDLDELGRDIDECLSAGRYDAAVALCREILRRSPRSVRPRCTLAWLCVGKGRLADAQSEIIAYVSAARDAGQTARAAEHIRRMIGATFSPDVRRFLAEQLARLGYPAEAQQTILELHEDLAATRNPPEEQQRRIWRAALAAALNSE